MQEISLHLLDIAQNSISARAHRIRISIREDTAADRLAVVIKDDGTGMSPELLARVESPFTTTRTTRRVGLGIPMLKQSALGTGGTFRIDSTPGAGTRIEAVYGLSHIDRAPMGDLPGTLLTLIAANPDVDWQIDVAVDGNAYEFDTAVVRETLGEEVPLDHPDVLGWIRSDLEEGISSLHGGM